MKLVYENGDSVAISSLYQIVKDKIEMPEGYELTAFDIDGQVKADPEHSMENILINQDKYVNLRCNKEVFPLFFEALEDGSSLALKQTDGAPELCVKISYDGETWQDYTVGDTIELPRAGDRVFFRSGALVNKTFALSEDAYSRFEMSGKLKGGGDIMSLVDCRMDAHDLDYECCFRRMFENCDALTTPPCLTMISLSPRCYDSMFKGCSSLVQAPKLPITFLKESCYESMFEGCSSLVQAPALPAEKLAKRCYAKMFKGCSSLRSMDVGFTEWNDADGCTEEWIPDAGGTFTHFDGLDLSRQDVSHVPFSWDKERKLDYLSFTAWADNSTVALGTRCHNYASRAVTGYVFEFSVDRKNWFSYSIPRSIDQPASVFGKTLYLANFGDTIYIRSSSDVVRSSFSVAKNSEDKTRTYWASIYKDSGNLLASPTGINDGQMGTYARYHFSMTGKVAAGGNIMSLLDKTATTITGVAEKEGDSLFAWLFYGCDALVTPPKLPLKTLTRQCYAGMFYGCSSLKSAPALPAEKLVWACYTYMFCGCKSLQEAPALASTELANWCYYGMFYGCGALETPPQLPATGLSQYCYESMFYGCGALDEVRPLPAAVLAKNCYANMFAYCRSLKQTPDLAVAEQAENACKAMYMGCERLERASDLSAQTLAKGCYGAIYADCKNLANGPAFAFDSYGSADSSTFAESLSGCTILRNATVAGPSYDAAMFAASMFANINTPGTLSVSQAFYEQCGEHPAFLPATWTAVPAEVAV